MLERAVRSVIRGNRGAKAVDLFDLLFFHIGSYRASCKD